MDCLSKHKELSSEVIACLSKTVNGSSKHFVAVFFFKCFCFIGLNARILLINGGTKIIAGVVEENKDYEDLCENASVVFETIIISTFTSGDINTFFLDVGGFAFVLALLDKYSKNKIICENLTFVINAFFINIKNFLGNETEKELNKFVKSDGIEKTNKVMIEQTQERNVVVCCTTNFLILSLFEGNFTMHIAKNPICIFIHLQTNRVQGSAIQENRF